MGPKSCGCADRQGEGSCTACPAAEVFSYWCETCKRPVPEKRCPYCGLKARRKRSNDSG